MELISNIVNRLFLIYSADNHDMMHPDKISIENFAQVNACAYIYKQMLVQINEPDNLKHEKAHVLIVIINYNFRFT